MSLNLIDDPWIPILDRSGNRRIIAPWEIADPEILRPDWPRADLNVACLEFLIGLVYLADPPAGLNGWRARSQPGPHRLRDRLAAYAPAFNLLGDGPLFLQDLEPLEGDANPPDMLFIDSAGANTAKNNADLMVHRGRYTGLDLPLAAMALFAFQAFAPSGGAGNRTSMRGGGPMVTLADPQKGLWALVWANVPDGSASDINELPWMRKTRVSSKALETFPPEGRLYSVEAFFGMPRRLRLVAQDGVVNGVIQKPYGTNYAVWQHPLTPYYRRKPGEVALPAHPRAGHFGYRNWLGVLAASQNSELAQRAACIETFENRTQEIAEVIVAGWSMDNMKPRDFIYSQQPLISLSEENQIVLEGLISAADSAAIALRGSLKPVLAEGEAREAEREAFYIATEPDFLARLESLKSGQVHDEIRDRWLNDLRREALRRFDRLSLSGLDRRDTGMMAAIVSARRNLTASFAGHGKIGKQLFEALMMTPPATKGKAA